METVSPIFEDRSKGRSKGVLAVIAAVILVVSLLFVSQAKAFEKVKNCTISEYGIRLFYLVGPRVPLVVSLADADSMQVFNDFFRAFTQDYRGDFLGKYANPEDVERAEREYRKTIAGNLAVTNQLVFELYGGHWLNPKRLSCTVCTGDECRVLHADVRFSTTRISHPVDPATKRE